MVLVIKKIIIIKQNRRKFTKALAILDGVIVGDSVFSFFAVFYRFSMRVNYFSNREKLYMFTLKFKLFSLFSIHLTFIAKQQLTIRRNVKATHVCVYKRCFWNSVCSGSRPSAGSLDSCEI